MSTNTSPVKQGGDVPAPISYESLLEASELLLDNLGSSELNSRTIQWESFPALMKLWEVLWQAQSSLVQESERVQEHVEASRLEDARLLEIRADMDEIIAGKHKERDRHFSLGLYWRRHAIWRYFRTHLQQPEKARDLLHLYLVKAAGSGPQAGETCRPRCIIQAEQTILLDIASKQRNRIRELAQWLTDHPDAATLLRDTKGKGKGKAREGNDNDIVLKQKAHFERCLEEVEPRQRLKELIASTNDWINCFKSRLDAIRSAKTTLHELEQRQRHVSSALEQDTSQKKRTNGSATAQVTVPYPKRRKTVDRGTSPIQEVVDQSIYLEQSQNYGRSTAGIAVHTDTAPFPNQATDAEAALQEDESPPSPQSLPSPPPHAQARPKQSIQTVTEESQQSTTDSSFKPTSLPSVQSLPPVQSSSSGDDGYRMSISRDTTTVGQPGGAEIATASTTKIIVRPVKRPRKSTVKLPPVSSEIQQLLEEAALEAQKKRKEEKQRLGELDYDPWWKLQDWVPPESQIPPGDEPEPEAEQVSVVQEETVQSNISDDKSEEMYTATSRIIGTFEALDTEGSETASQTQRERDDDEARIAEFLRSEDL